MASSPTSSQIVAKMGLSPHPEGGFYHESFRDSSIILSRSQLPPRYKVDRPVSTSIYFLLPSGSVSNLHRIPMAETWHFYLGEPLVVVELHDNGNVKLTHLGPVSVEGDQQPQYTVPPNVWFGSFPAKDYSFSTNGHFSPLKTEPRDPETHYSLVGCTCAPAFQYQDFELGKRSELLTLFPHLGSVISMLTLSDS